jgi:hypothetical protein
MATLASDDFDRANNADIGANWTPSGGGFKIVSNAAAPTNTASDSFERYTAISWPDDQYAEATISGIDAASGGEGIGVICRADTTGVTTFYRLVGSASNFRLSRYNTGASTTLVEGAGTTFAVNDVIRLEIRTIAEGAYYTCLKNGIPFTSGLDSSPLTSGQAGIVYSSTSTSAALASWSGGSLQAVKLAGVPINITWAAGADPAGQSVTVPSSTTCAIMFWAYGAASGNGLSSATLAGAAPDATFEVPTAASGQIGIGAARWDNPPTGSQTLDTAWDTSPTLGGPVCSVAFLTGASPDAWRDVDGDQDTSTNAVTVTVTTLSDDLVLKYNANGNGNAVGISSGWQSYNSQLRDIDARLSWIWASTTTQVCDGENEGVPALVALSFGAEEIPPITDAPETLRVVRAAIRTN